MRSLLLVLISANTIFSQSVSRDALEEFFSDSDQIAFHRAAHQSGWKQIILVRHGKPDVSLKGWVNRQETDDYLQRYITAEVHAIDTSKIMLEPWMIDTLFCSSLNRAKTTAALVNQGMFPIKEEPLFREFENRAVGMPNLRLPKGIWLGTSRVFWLMGLNQKDIESHKSAKTRSKLAANKLASMAFEKDRVMLVAHGFLNRYLDKYLRQMGWQKVRDDGHDYLATKVFVLQVQQ